MGRKKKAQNIQTQLKARTTAQLEKALEGVLDIPDPDPDKPFDISQAEEWCGESPPHIIDGAPYEDRKKQKEAKDETTP